MAETQYTTKTLQIGNSMVIIRRPILTDEERQKAEEKVIQALRSIYKG